MEGLVYLSVRVGCAAYLLYKVWEQKKKYVSSVTCYTRR